MNNATISGILAHDPEMRYQETRSLQQTTICRSLLKIAEWIGGELVFGESTVEVIAWGAKGEEMSGSLRQGQEVIFFGRLEIDQRDSPHGWKNKVPQLVVSKFLLLNATPERPPVAVAKTPKQVVSSPADEIDPGDVSANYDLDDIPF